MDNKEFYKELEKRTREFAVSIIGLSTVLLIAGSILQIEPKRFDSGCKPESVWMKNNPRNL